MFYSVRSAWFSKHGCNFPLQVYFKTFVVNICWCYCSHLPDWWHVLCLCRRCLSSMKNYCPVGFLTRATNKYLLTWPTKTYLLMPRSLYAGLAFYRQYYLFVFVSETLLCNHSVGCRIALWINQSRKLLFCTDFIRMSCLFCRHT